MKISIMESPECAETEIVIKCRVADDQVMQLLAALHAGDKKITGTRDGRTFVLDPDDIFYLESVEKKTVLHLSQASYETTLRLYELESRFAHSDFFRASKSCIINLAKVKMLNPMFGGKIEMILENGQHLWVSRQYVPSLKEKLGM